MWRFLFAFTTHYFAFIFERKMAKLNVYMSRRWSIVFPYFSVLIFFLRYHFHMCDDCKHSKIRRFYVKDDGVSSLCTEITNDWKKKPISVECRAVAEMRRRDICSLVRKEQKKNTKNKNEMKTLQNTDTYEAIAPPTSKMTCTTNK